MSNPAVLAWLQEIAAAKSAATTKQQLQPNGASTAPPETAASPTTAETPTTCPSSSLSPGTDSPKHPKSAIPTASSVRPRYGIFVNRHSLQTRQPIEYSLVLPPAPQKPDPGECCGNDCVPCINTLYWEDVEAHRQIVARLQKDFERVKQQLHQESNAADGSRGAGATIELVQEGQYQVLAATAAASATVHPAMGRKDGEDGDQESSETTADLVKRIEEGLHLVQGSAGGQGGNNDNDDDDDEQGLSIRAYRPFRILEKRYVSHDTLRIVCDVNAPAPTRDLVTFHVLIRFKLGDGRMVTKAFTPVAPEQEFPDSGARASRDLHNKLTFLIKLYPPPHETSILWRTLLEAPGKPGGGGEGGGQGDDESRDVLYMRGPIHTGFHLKDEVTHLVMIAAGSGITPMYQVLQEFQRRRQQGWRPMAIGDDKIKKEESKVAIDLIFCNRSVSDIWLRDEIVRAVTPTPSAAKGARSGKEGGECDSEVDSRVKREPALVSAPVATKGTTSKSRIVSSSAQEDEWTVSIRHVLSSQGPEEVATTDATALVEAPETMYHGRLQFDLVQRVLAQAHLMNDETDHMDQHTAPSSCSPSSLTASQKRLTQILICGPPSFNRDMEKYLSMAGYTSEIQGCEVYVFD